jgi:hypothetical protein
METATITMKSKIEEALNTINSNLTIKELLVDSNVNLTIEDSNFNHVIFDERNVIDVSLVGNAFATIQLKNSSIVFVYSKNFSVVI